MDGNTYIKLLQEAYVRNGLEKKAHRPYPWVNIQFKIK